MRNARLRWLLCVLCQILALLITYFLLVVQFVNPASSSIPSAAQLATNYTTAAYD